jgi:2-dehydropantoate 2-reductase
MKIGIYGAGSIGCYIGAHLLLNSKEVVFMGREKLQKEILKNGFHISDYKNNQFHIPNNKIKYVTDPNYLKDADCILFTMKSGNTIESCNELKRILKTKSPLLISFQNGVSNSEKISSILGSHCLAGMVPYNVVYQGEGKFHSGTSGYLLIEEKEPYSSLILNEFKNSLEIKSHSNLKNILWGKLIFNLNNSINALAGIPLKEELSNPIFRKILAASMNESLRILEKSNIQPASLGKLIPWLAPFILKLPNFLFFRVASNMIKIDPEARSSMWEDLNQNRNTEFEFINGEIIKLAKLKNLKAPIQEKLKELILEAEKNKKGSPNLKAEELYKLLFI